MRKAPLMKPGRKPPVDLREVDSIPEVLPDTPLERLETLLIFDARCLDRDTQHKLLTLLPELVHIRRAWKAEYLENGCACCHKKNTKNTWYGAGGFCHNCTKRLYMRMRNRFREAMNGRNLPAEVDAFRDALCLKYNAAQRLFNGDD